MKKDIDIEDLKGSDIADLGPCGDGDVHHVALHKDGIVTYGHARQSRSGETLLPGGCLLQEENGKVVDGYVLAGGSGPAQVSTPQYRDNYENIFGKKNSEMN